MKTIVCEVCGNSNLAKQDGVFVCQSCGTRYSAEDVKNLLVEIAEESASNAYAMPDNSAQLSKFVDMAEVAIKAENLKEAVEYANKALEIDNKHYYAYYLKGLSIAYQTSVVNPRFEEGIKYMLVGIDYVSQDKKADLQELITTSAFKILNNHLGLLCAAYSEGSGVSYENIENGLAQIFSVLDVLDGKGCTVDRKSFGESMSKQLTSAATAYWNGSFYPTVKNSSNIFYANDILILVNEYKNVCALLTKALSLSKSKANKIKCYEGLINISNAFKSLQVRQPDKDVGSLIKSVLPRNARTALIDNIMSWHTEWNSLDSSHQIPKRPSASGCYVATCVYGSYDCPQVWTLRRYRDNTLDSTWYGRLFIKLYYAISPTLVKWFGHTKWFKKMWKGKLDKMVKKLNSKGVENTPYCDKY